MRQKMKRVVSVLMLAIMMAVCPVITADTAKAATSPVYSYTLERGVTKYGNIETVKSSAGSAEIYADKISELATGTYLRNSHVNVHLETRNNGMYVKATDSASFTAYGSHTVAYRNGNGVQGWYYQEVMTLSRSAQLSQVTFATHYTP